MCHAFPVAVCAMPFRWLYVPNLSGGCMCPTFQVACQNWTSDADDAFFYGYYMLFFSLPLFSYSFSIQLSANSAQLPFSLESSL